MRPRTDLITTSRVDLALILLPATSWLEASCMLALSGVPGGGGGPGAGPAWGATRAGTMTT
jgi:hypothetical protein